MIYRILVYQPLFDSSIYRQRVQEYPLHRVLAFFVSLACTHDRLCNPLCFSLLACTQSTRKYNGNQPERSRSELMNEIKSVPFVDSSLTGGGKSRENVRSTGSEGREGGFVANSDRYDAYTPGSQLRYYRRVPLRLPISPTFSESVRAYIRA